MRRGGTAFHLLFMHYHHLCHCTAVPHTLLSPHSLLCMPVLPAGRRLEGRSEACGGVSSERCLPVSPPCPTHFYLPAATCPVAKFPPYCNLGGRGRQCLLHSPAPPSVLSHYCSVVTAYLYACLPHTYSERREEDQEGGEGGRRKEPAPYLTACHYSGWSLSE